jgi:5'(3')-deoxyribonucleotidase
MADFTGSVVEQYNFLTGENIKTADIKNPKIGKCVSEPSLVYRIINCPGFMRGLKPVDGAVEGVKELHRQGHTILFVSNGSNCPTSGHEKREWLRYYFSKTWRYAPLVLTYQKQYVRGDCLLDDRPSNLENLFPDCKPLLFDAPYNQNETRFERIYDWTHFLDWVEKNK